MTREDEKTLERHGFRVEDKRPEREYHVVTCNTCKQRWAVANKHQSAMLALLDHAIGHESGKAVRR